MSLDLAFSALADPTRRTLLSSLETGERTLSDLARPLPMTLMAVQKHVKVLEDAGLVSTRKVGRSRHVRLRAHGLHHAQEWIRQAEKRWTAAFDRLEQALAEEDAAQTRPVGAATTDPADPADPGRTRPPHAHAATDTADRSGDDAT